MNKLPPKILLSNCKMKNKQNPDFNKMKSEIRDLFNVNAYIYWCDLLLSVFFAWGLFILASVLSFENTIYYYILILLCAVSFYRAIAFTHELVHVKKGSLPWFHLIWHIFCGMPLLAPHFLYKSIHISHHSRKDYGKNTDGEYIEFGTESRWLIVLHFAYNLVIPIFSVFRFMILTIVSFSNSKLRLLVMEKMSFMGLRFTFVRKLPREKSDLFKWYCEEFSCWFLTWLVLVLILFEKIPLKLFFQWYFVMIIILTMNSLRSLGATHWYKSTGNDMSFMEQIRDSLSVTSNSVFTHIFCPVGTQYHALHHMFPGIPYHSLGRAYWHLVEKFPEEKILTETSSPSLWDTWKNLWFLPRKNDFLVKTYSDSNGNALEN